MNRVILSPEYFPNPTIGRPIANADIYVGIVDLDPTVLANQKQISVQQESGVIVQVAQPINTGAGGVPLYLGSPVTILVEGNYSLKVLDSTGGQLYYVPSNAEFIGTPLQFEVYADMRASTPTANNTQAMVSGRTTGGDNGGGPFRFSTADLSSQVTADPESGVYVAPTSDLTGASGAWVRNYSGSVNVKWFGAIGDGVTDDTEAIRAASVAGLGVFFTEGDYVVVLDPTDREDTLCAWSGERNIDINGVGARILDNTVYIANDPNQSIFSLTNCANVRVEGIEYKGVELADITLGSQIGATFVRLIGTTKQVSVSARITDARYGVKAGSYFDPSLGGASHIDVDLFCLRTGYPLVTYLADMITGTIYAEDPHRACYIGGCRGGSLIVRFKNQHIANEICLLTDSTTVYRTPGDLTILHIDGGGRGCSDFKLVAIDTSSPTTEAASTACAINTSWGNPGTYFANLEFEFYVRSSDANSATVGGFKILGEPPIGLYPNFLMSNMPFTYYENIKVNGVIDRSQQTIAGSSGNEILVICYNAGAAVGNSIKNLVFDEVIYKHGTFVTKPNMQLYTKGAAGSVVFRDCDLDNTLTLDCSVTEQTILENTSIDDLISAGNVKHRNSSIGTFTTSSLEDASLEDSTFNGSFIKTKVAWVDVALLGAFTFAGQLQANSLVISVSGKITETITGATGFTVGIAGAETRYADITGTAIGTTFQIGDFLSSEMVRWQRVTENLRVTAKTADFTAGQIKVAIVYMVFGTPNV